MGLESVDLIRAVEDAFGFRIPAEDAVGLDTAGKLEKYVLAHRFRGYPEDCLTGIAFYKLQLAMTSVLKIPREAIRGSTGLSEIVPGHRRRAWHRLEQEVGLRLPPLRRPAWAVKLAASATVGLGIAVPVMLSLSLFGGAILTAILTMFAAGYLFAWMTKPLAIEFYADCKTMDQLASLTLALNYYPIAEQLNASVSDAEVREKIGAIVAEKTGIGRDRPAEEAVSIRYRTAG